MAAFIPEDYLPEPGQRLTFYRRLSTLSPWNVQGLTVQGSHFALKIGTATSLSPARVIQLLEKSRGKYRLTPDMTLSRHDALAQDDGG